MDAIHDHAGQCRHDHSAGVEPATVKDPVCGMTVDPAATPHHHAMGGAAYHFCSAGCRNRFVADPHRYLHPAPAAADVQDGAVWTCPMHPEIRQSGPGSCPICGMALEPEIPTLAAALERASEHPLAAAIVEGAEERGLALPVATDFYSHTGKGVSGTVEGREVALGNKVLLADLGIDSFPLMARADEMRSEGQGVMFVAVDGRPAGLVSVADPVKESAPGAIAELRRDGVRVVMLTGDGRRTAEAVSRQVGGIDDVIADVLPDQKQAVVERLRASGRRVAMTGDGINDAPALAAADVGIAMGTGTDVAMESAAVTLVSSVAIIGNSLRLRTVRL